MGDKIAQTSHYYVNGLSKEEPKPCFTVIDKKNWGTEYIICRKPHAAKIMTLIPGAKCSNHMHWKKSESFVLIQGTLIVETTCLLTGKTTTITMRNQFDSITLQPNTPHTFYCPKDQTYDTVFIEASTEDSINDSYRLSQSSGPEE
jgi:D-lyxose ketol-isomerase